MRHVNIPIFIPHLGCPNQCVFCNQRHISGVSRFDPASVIPTIESALTTVTDDTDVEIAFFGGSFTGIDRKLMIELLKIANSYIQNGRVSSIRCSTRPDYINDEILSILAEYGVKTIELGLQTASDAVLSLSKRGHSFSDEKNACKMIVARGFSLVGQMMIGLPGATPRSEVETAEFIISSGASGARIYPTVVFHDTELCSMAESGEYDPLSIEEAISRSVEPLMKFLDAGIEVIRIGLCASENLSDASTYHSGPNHPALGELIMSRVYYKRAEQLLSGSSCHGKTAVIYVPIGSLSKVIGQKKENKLRLIREFGLADVKFVQSDELAQYELKLAFEGDT